MAPGMTPYGASWKSCDAETPAHGQQSIITKGLVLATLTIGALCIFELPSSSSMPRSMLLASPQTTAVQTMPQVQMQPAMWTRVPARSIPLNPAYPHPMDTASLRSQRLFTQTSHKGAAPTAAFTWLGAFGALAALGAALHRLIGPPQQQVAMMATSSQDDDAAQQRRNLVEEIETPYRKFRYFLYVALGSAAMLSFLINLPRLAANLSGINAETTNDTITNLGINAVALAAIAFAYNKDRESQLKRLERIKIGAGLAGLKVQFSNSLEKVKLSDFRRGRGRSRRIVIAAGNPAALQTSLEQAKSLSERLTSCDLLVVPVVLPISSSLVAPPVDADLIAGEHVAVPTSGDWASVIGIEVDRAVEQGFDAESKGFTIVIKKNGRIGQRITGLPPYGRLIGEVEERMAKGLDVENI